MHGGSRLDQKYTAYMAEQLLNKIAPDRKSGRTIEIDLSQYQKPDGGYGILPYSESDPELSALLSPLLKNEAGAQRLKQYFYSLIFNEPGRINAPALYGLAEMAEPVLIDLNNALDVQNLSLRDYMYLALAYEALGESHTAEKIYNEKVAPVLENKSPYIRVKNSDDTDEILKDTALAAVLASRLDMPDKEGLFEYAAGNYSRKILINAEKLMYVIEEYKKLPNTDVEFTYEYGGNTYTEKISSGGSVSVSVPSVKLSEFNITEVSGEASVVSVYNAPLLKLIEQDQNLKIKRTYYSYATGKETTEFRQDDIVKVVLEWDALPAAIDTFYEITDFAPSGLKPIEITYQIAERPDKELVWWFRNVDGQKVTFNVYRDAINKDALVYYARVVSPGTFTADGTIMQGTLVKDSILLGRSTILKISE
jgi:tetratricopeptide (TPR) repeat protein